MSKRSESKRRRREARKLAGWHPLAEWYRATSGAIIPAATVADHQYSKLSLIADPLHPDLATVDLATLDRLIAPRRTKAGVFERGILTLPDDVMRRFVEQAGGSDHLAKALDEATKRCKNVVKLGE